ncbi:MAG TPA: helix-turn-helix domain-containing protein [Chloroflexota bacterium]|nr:helix-turn-helix domain-containing protein [Chloroflexota bacterium]
MLTVSETVKLLKVSRVTLYRLCDRKELPYYTLPGIEGRRFKKSEVLKLYRPGNAAAGEPAD